MYCRHTTLARPLLACTTLYEKVRFSVRMSCRCPRPWCCSRRRQRGSWTQIKQIQTDRPFSGATSSDAFSKEELLLFQIITNIQKYSIHVKFPMRNTFESGKISSEKKTSEEAGCSGIFIYIYFSYINSNRSLKYVFCVPKVKAYSYCL